MDERIKHFLLNADLKKLEKLRDMIMYDDSLTEAVQLLEIIINQINVLE